MIKTYKDDCWIPNITHKIVVRSKISHECDTRSFSIHTENDSKQLFKAIERLLFVFTDYEKENMVFVDDKGNTHQVVMCDIEKNKWYSCNISLSTHSATDIANVIYPFLCGGRVNEWRKKTKKGAEYGRD